MDSLKIYPIIKPSFCLHFAVTNDHLPPSSRGAYKACCLGQAETAMLSRNNSKVCVPASLLSSYRVQFWQSWMSVAHLKNCSCIRKRDNTLYSKMSKFIVLKGLMNLAQNITSVYQAGGHLIILFPMKLFYVFYRILRCFLFDKGTEGPKQKL